VSYLAVVVSAAVLIAGCSDGTRYIGSNAEPAACDAPRPPPPELALDEFYTKYVDARGIPVVSSASVSDLALDRACDIAVHVLGKREDVRAPLVRNGMRVAVIGHDQVMTDIPEYRDLYSAFPELDWDRDARSVGATLERPVSSVAEENLLCLAEDLFIGEAMLVHSIAHGLRRLGILELEVGWDARLRSAYDTALSGGLWADTHAATAADQYWAEGVQDWYDANQQAMPADGLHNHVNTRSELTEYDPELAVLIAEYVPDDSWRPACP
jgi:hypothetical protein